MIYFLKTINGPSKAIVNKHRVRIEVDHNKMTIKPLSILYMHYDYWFTYEFQHKIHTVSLKSIQSLRSRYKIF